MVPSDLGCSRGLISKMYPCEPVLSRSLYADLLLTRFATIFHLGICRLSFPSTIDEVFDGASDHALAA